MTGCGRLACYVKLSESFANTEYGMYAALRSAWLLNKTGKPENRRRAMGLYLDLAHKAQNPKVAEESLFFASQLSLADGHHEDSANLFNALRTKFPKSTRIAQAAIGAGWANYHIGHFKEGSEILDLVIGDKNHASREEILYLKANCLRQLERRDEAVKFYATQLAEFPDGRLAERAWYEKLTTVYRDGRHADVLRVASKRVPPPELTR